MTEPGSDQMFSELADTSAINHGYRLERLGLLLEEWRVRMQPTDAPDEPGQDYPDPDETPPGDPPEFDPTPSA
jgi:hypothetical protein